MNPRKPNRANVKAAEITGKRFQLLYKTQQQRQIILEKSLKSVRHRLFREDAVHRVE